MFYPLLIVLISFVGTLSGEVHVIFQPNPSSDRVVLQASIPTGLDNENESTQDFHRLISRSLLWETESFDRNEILDHFQNFGMDVDPNTMIHVDQNHTIIRLTSSIEELSTALQLLHEIIKNPTLSNDAIEIERGRILESEPLSSLNFTTPNRVETFHQDHFLHQPIAISIEGNIDSKAGLEFAKKAFHSQNVTCSVQNAPQANSTISQILQSKEIEHTFDDEKYILIDGKIVMVTPSFYQTQKFQKWFGWSVLTGSIVAIIAGGICLLVTPFSGGMTIPFALIAGSILGFGTSICSLNNEPLNDPKYVAKLRKSNLNSTFTKVYTSGHFLYTLTPLEWRKLFVHEHRYSPSITSLSGKYDLWSTPFEKMFSVEEHYSLKTLVNYYRKEMNILIRIKDSIEEALAHALEPARQFRDEQLGYTEIAYEVDHFVMRKEELLNQRDDLIAEIKAQYKIEKQKINANDHEGRQNLKNWKEEEIQKIEDWYEDAFYPDVQVGVSMAASRRDRERGRILAEYSIEKEQIKQELDYDTAVAEYYSRKAELIDQCNQDFRNRVLSFPIAYPDIEDFLIHPNVNQK